ncbi:hypothetical protein RZS08_60755, partial [Arthrospira platensis SPKY1]|nr:hypothetical protein [Arthrospira platensis SPKY1]
MNHLELFKKIQNCAAHLIKKTKLEKDEESLKMESNEVKNKNFLFEQLIKKTDEIPGWLSPEAACFSSHLLSYQEIINLTGNIVEIGIYC